MSDVCLPVINSAHIDSLLPELQAYTKSLNTKYFQFFLSSSYSCGQTKSTKLIKLINPFWDSPSHPAAAQFLPECEEMNLKNILV